MKKSLFFLVIPVLFSTTGCSRSYKPKELDPSVKYDNVYLIMGQSNASGVSEYSFLEESHPDIYQTYSIGNQNILMSYDVVEQKEEQFVPTKFGFGHTSKYFGPEIGIADTLSKYEESCYMVKASLGGSCLRTQYVTEKGKKKELYTQFVGFISWHILNFAPLLLQGLDLLVVLVGHKHLAKVIFTAGLPQDLPFEKSQRGISPTSTAAALILYRRDGVLHHRGEHQRVGLLLAKSWGHTGQGQRYSKCFLHHIG